MVEIALRALLLADPAVAAIVGSRIAPLVLPEGTELPALTYVVVHEEPHESHEGPSGLATVMVQFSAWADESGGESGYTATRKLAAAVGRALLGRAQEVGGVSIEAISGGSITTEKPELDTDIWHTFIEFEVIARTHNKENNNG